MKKMIFDSYQDLSANTALLIAAIISEKPDALLCFPAGETSVGTFEQLIGLNRTGKLSFRKCRIVGLDEWNNLGPMKSENCFSFLKKHLFDHIDYSKENMCFFNGESPDTEKECKKTDDFIKRYGPVDMILLGMGMNGHLGLNEPGTPFNLYSHVVKLDSVTKKVGQKYFSGMVSLTSGVTMGIKHIMESHTSILQVSGAKKAEIVKRLIDSDISPALPATALKSHSNSFLLLDKEASTYL
jgi:glucosamine-6-phosphate isomerase